MRFRFWSRASWMVLVSVAACAPDESEDTKPLPQQSAAAPKLQLAIVSASFGHVTAVKGGFEGAFPERFRLTELPPPPAEEFVPSGLVEGGKPVPASLVAAVGAVEVDRIPSWVPTRLTWDWSCGATREEGCTGKSKTCGRSLLDCTKVEIHCDIEDRNCTLTSVTGSLTPLRSSQRQLEGRVDGHFLLYLDADAPAGSFLSRLHADGAPLAAGWHLVRSRKVEQRDAATRDRCEREASIALAAVYARELGRSFADPVEVPSYLMLVRYNAKKGTTLQRIEDIDQDDPDFEQIAQAVTLEWDTRSMSELLAHQCYDVSEYGVVGAVGSRELSMTLAEPLPQVGAFFPDGPPFNGTKAPLDWPWF